MYPVPIPQEQWWHDAQEFARQQPNSIIVSVEEESVTHYEGGEDLKEQFMFQLVLMLGPGGVLESPTIGVMWSSPDKTTICLSPRCPPVEDSYLNETLDTISRTLSQIRCNGDGAGRHNLRRIIFEIYRSRWRKHILDLSKLFCESKNTIAELVSIVFGVEDKPEGYDAQVCDGLVKLNARIPQASLPEELQPDEILDTLEEICQFPNLKEKLMDIFGPQGATFYEKIWLAGQPLRTTNTFILAAKTFSQMSSIRIRCGFPPTSVSSLPPVLENFLEAKDREVEIFNLKPKAKNLAFQLLVTLHFEGISTQLSKLGYWYPFGFAAVRKSEVSHLKAIYKYILFDANSEVSYLRTNCRSILFGTNQPGTNDPVEIFSSLWRAFENATLDEFFDDHCPSAMRLFPDLKKFFSFGHGLKPSVYRLNLFIQTADDVKPTEMLRRDYGFQRCNQKDKVEYLKKKYEELIQKIGLSALHDACMGIGAYADPGHSWYQTSKISEAMVAAGITIDPRYAHIFCNEPVLPGMGYERQVV